MLLYFPCATSFVMPYIIFQIVFWYYVSFISRHRVFSLDILALIEFWFELVLSIFILKKKGI